MKKTRNTWRLAEKEMPDDGGTKKIGVYMKDFLGKIWRFGRNSLFLPTNQQNITRFIQFIYDGISVHSMVVA